MKNIVCKIILFSAAAFIYTMTAADITHCADPFSLSSEAFENQTRIPDRFTCKGADKSPPLLIKGTPRRAKSLALLVDDPDAPAGRFIHWVLFNIPPGTKRIPEGASRSSLPAVAKEGKNDFGKTGYNGPCPPPGKPHHYRFTLYALDTAINLPAGVTTAEELEAAMTGHIIAESRLTGIFSR